MGIEEYIVAKGGYVSSADAKKDSMYDKLIYAVSQGKVERVKYGIYTLATELAKQMIDIEKIIPGGVLCLYSAWSYYELTTQIPHSYFIAVEKSRKVSLPDYPPIEISYWAQKSYEIGITVTKIDGVEVKIYDLEKSVCDAVKFRNKIGIDVCSEILKSYLARKGRNLTRLYEYAAKLRVANTMDELVKFLI